MSRIEMSMRAYDVLDQVQIVVRIVQADDYGVVDQDWETLVVTRIQGSGVTDGREWVQDALIAAMEAL